MLQPLSRLLLHLSGHISYFNNINLPNLDLQKI